MKTSIKWPLWAKTINGFKLGRPFFDDTRISFIFTYLILLGIGFGNISTYLLIKSYSKYDNKEQFVVGIIASYVYDSEYCFQLTCSLISNLVHHHILSTF